jgi:hypothetical protein
MSFKPAPMSGLSRRSVHQGRSADLIPFRNPRSAQMGVNDEQARQAFFAANPGPAFHEPDLESVSNIRALSGRYSPLPLILSLTLIFFIVLAICWSLWEP